MNEADGPGPSNAPGDDAATPSGDLARLSWMLAERTKELELVHSATRLLGSARTVDAEVLASLAAMLPLALQFPASASARIRWGDLSGQTPGWMDAPCTLRTPFEAGGTKGLVEVAYSPSSSPCAFLDEEVALLESFASTLAAHVGRAAAERSLAERESRLQFLQDLHDATTGAGDVDELLPIVLRMLGSHLKVSRCTFGHIEHGSTRIAIPHQYVDGCAPIVGPWRMTEYGMRRMSAPGAIAVIRDVEREMPPDAVARNVGHDVRATIVCSMVRQGGLEAVIVVQQTTPRDWTDHEVALVAEVAARTWALIAQRAAEAKLRQGEALLRIAGDAAGLGGWSIDLATHTLGWSEQARRIHEVPPGAVVTQEEALALYAPEHRDALRRAIDAAASRGEPFDIELELVTPRGRRAWVRVVGRPERDAGGAVIRVQGAIQDISERRRLADQLRDAQKMDAFGHLAGGIAHDFNNILSVILTYSAFILEGPTVEPSVRADVEQIHKAGRSAAVLTRQLLTLSRHQVQKPLVLDLNAVLAELERMLSRVLPSNVRLVLDLGDPGGLVLADPGQLEQVIMNLVVNARDAMPEGGELTVGTRCVDLDETYARSNHGVVAGPHVLMSVSDTGVGMDAATRSRVFEPFFTTKAAGRGTGLGLAMVHAIVTQSRGHVLVTSAPGAGTTFEVALPRVLGQRETAVASAPTVIKRGTETVLLVEPDDAVRKTLHSALRRAGYKVLEASGPGEALLLAESHAGSIDLLLAVLILPLLSARALHARLLATRPRLRAVGLSGPDDPALAAPRGADEMPVVCKPFTPEEILGAVRDALDRPDHQARLEPTPGAAPVPDERKILLVDDDPALVPLLARMLARTGHRAVGFTEPASALAALRAGPSSFAALVTDLVMPGMNGFDLARAARAEHPDLAVIVISGELLPDDVETAERLGIDVLLEKTSLTAEELDRVLGTCLAGRAARGRRGGPGDDDRRA